MELTAVALWLNTVFAGFDQTVTLAIHRLYDIAGGFFTPFFEFLSYFCYAGLPGLPLIIIAFVLLFIKKTRRIGFTMLAALAIGALVTNLVLKVYVARPRPYLTDFYRNLWLTVGQNTESDMSFPSGHTQAAFGFSVAGYLTIKNKRKGSLLLIFAVLIAVARIYLVLHYPTDVIGGIIVGTTAAIIAYFISAKLPKRFYTFSFKKPKNPNNAKNERSI